MATFKKFNLPFGSATYPSSGATNIYTHPGSTDKASVIVGLSVSNTSSFDLPCDVWLKKGGTSLPHYLAKERTIKAGETIQLIDSGQKVVLEYASSTADALWANAPTVDGSSTTTFSCWLFIYEDVN